jgi:hypothetical protein
MNELERWANFYLLTSAAAATLIGLLFVVITLASARRLKDASKIRIYLTPTIIYFASVLFIAAILTIPEHTHFSAAFCVCMIGVTCLAYSGTHLVRRDLKHTYYVKLDRIPYAGFPFAAYGILVLGGILLLHNPQFGLTLIATSVLSLLAVAIRNTWSIAVNLISNPHDSD